MTQGARPHHAEVWAAEKNMKQGRKQGIREHKELPQHCNSLKGWNRVPLKPTSPPGKRAPPPYDLLKIASCSFAFTSHYQISLSGDCYLFLRLRGKVWMSQQDVNITTGFSP